MKNSIIKDALILFAITLVAGILLGATYEITKEPIMRQKVKTRDAALKTVLGEADFKEEPVVLPKDAMIKNVFTATRNDEVIGYAFKVESEEGYGGNIEVIVGIDMDGKISGIDVIKHSETPGLGAKADQDSFKDQYKGKPATELTVVKGGAAGDSEIDSIGGATITSRAVTGTVNAASQYFNEHFSKGAE